jgi:hypothetical protein
MRGQSVAFVIRDPSPLASDSWVIPSSSGETLKYHEMSKKTEWTKNTVNQLIWSGKLATSRVPNVRS